MTTIGVSDSGKTKSREHRPQLYQCYVDVSELLYPGRTQARTIAQLHTYDSSEMLKKTGLDRVLFTDAVAGDTKQKENKGKISAKGDSSVNSATAEPEVASGSPLKNEKGEPVFVIVQFELQEPLVLARTTEELTDELHELLGQPDRLPLYPYTGDTPEKQYFNCIRKLVETITESYRDFNKENASGQESFNGNRSSQLGDFTASGNRYPYLPDEIDRFTQYLYDTGTYVAVRTTLKKRITRLLDQKFRMQSCTWNSEECQNFVANSYLYLVESMHAALNSESGDEPNNVPVDDADNLCSSAEESYELGNISRAKKNYTSLIATERKNPDAWLRYAIFLKKIGDLDRAVECCREAIDFNARHKIALLLYGVILAEKEDYRAAEIFLNTTIRMYPRFAEGWALLHLFYIRSEYYPGVDLAMRVTEQCLLDRDRDTHGMDFLEREPLAWSTIHCPKDRVYLRVVVFLLKLNLLDFAGIALARELALAGRSTSWLYYMAVHHYLLGRFGDALTHLEEARRQHGMDYSISGLMGHCHFKEGNSQAARECYEYASTLFDRPADIRLIGVRLGSYCLNAEEYSRARKIFLSVCKVSPSSCSWLGLGTACYHMMELKDAETALTEANRLDHTDPEVWAYLCLLNMRLHRHDEFTECYRQTVKITIQKACHHLEMRIAKSTLVFLVFVLMLSVLVANVANLINVNSPADVDEQLHNGPSNSSPMWTQPRKYEIGDSTDRLMWFLQISDIHISIFKEPSRITELKEFCDVTVSALAPSVVIASGDLTDSKTKDGMGSRQILSEWKHYKQVLDESEVTKKTIWLDVRGNHDNFNVLHINSTDNFYSNYSIQGKKHPRSYMRRITVGPEKYTFVAIDACLQPGPRRPFNFVGALDAGEIEKIHRLVAESRRKKSDYIFWFGHYPTSCIIAQCDDGVRSLMGRYKESMVYMCGHYHMLGGLVPNMYTLQQAGFLELELGDWKDNRMYRLAVIDHGQFSFTDIKHREWPVVLVTNPKHALYAMPQKENSQSIVESTHIRVLAFSLAPIKSVKIQIDDGSWQDCYHVKGPLYAVRWNPSEYTSGIHNIRASVIDDNAREKEISQPFTLDGTQLSFRVLPRLLLMSNASTIFQLFFGMILLILVVPLCVLRVLHVLCERNRMKRPRLRMPIFGWWIRKLWILSTIDRLFFPLVFYALYLTVGPWSVGEVIENQTGVVFAWGMFIGNVYLPGSFTYAYGFFQLFSFHLPLMMILAHLVDRRLEAIEKPPRKPPTMFRLLWRHLPFILLITMQSSMVYFFWLAYGTLAVILCPLRTWSIILGMFLWYQAIVLPHQCLRPAARVWTASGRLADRDADENQSTSR